MRVLAVDVGGSSVKSAVALTDGTEVTFERPAISHPLPSRKFEDLRLLMQQITAEAFEHHERTPNAVAISTTGSVDSDGTVRNAGHFVGYRNISWKNELRAFIGETPVTTVNDGKASAWAEYVRAGRGVSPFVHFVVGTGVGGGVVVGGELVYGEHGTAGAFGHVKISTSSDASSHHICSCKNVGCVETFAAAPAIEREWQKQSGRSSETFSDTVTAAMAGEISALATIRDAGRYLGYGIANVISVLNPRVVTLGGGVVVATQKVELDGDGSGLYVRAAAESARALVFKRVADGTRIQPASYGNDGGLVGGILISVSRLER